MSQRGAAASWLRLVRVVALCGCCHVARTQQRPTWQRGERQWHFVMRPLAAQPPPIVVEGDWAAAFLRREIASAAVAFRRDCSALRADAGVRA